MQTVSKELLFGNFQKDEYRAFTPEGEDKPIHLQAVHERIMPVLMDLEKQMNEGDTLSITISVKNAEPEASSYGDAMAQNILNSAYGGFGRIVFSSPGGSSGGNSGGLYIP